ncbi:MAG: AI-2E family transporter [Patescibacteria group bacterium]
MLDNHISISIGTIVKIFVVALVFWALYLIRDLVLVVLTSVVIASSVEPFTRRLLRFKIPRVVSVIFLFLAFISLFLILLYFFVPPLFDEAANFFEALPQYLGFIKGFDSTLDGLFGAQNLLSDFSQNLGANNLLSNAKGTLFGLTGGALQTINFVFGGLTSFVLILVISFYLAVQDRGVENFLRVVTPVKHEKYIINLWQRSQNKIGLWMQGQLLLGLLIGVLIYLGLTILGVPYAFLLAIVGAVFELIPVFGPIMGAVPAVLLGFVSGGATLGFMVVGFYIIIQQFENHLIYPLVVRKITGVPPLLVILSLIIGFKLAGFLGIVLAVPVASALIEFVSDLEKRKTLSAERTNGEHVKDEA